MPYFRGSTANPTGWRPWNSRLSYYIENSFLMPTAGRGPFLLQPGAPWARPSAAGGLGAHFPNLATGRLSPANYRSRSISTLSKQPIYAPPEALRGLGFMGAGYSNTSVHAVGPARAKTPRLTTTPQTGTNAGTGWQQSGQQGRNGRGTRQMPSQPGQFVTSSPETGSITSYVPQSGTTPLTSSQYYGSQATGGIVGVDASGNPIYSSPPSGLVVTGTDAQGNPIYGSASAAAAAPVSSFSLSTWFSEDSLGLGLNNGIYTAAAALLAVWMTKGRR